MTLTEKSGHLAWRALVALALARQSGDVLSSAQENLFLTRWLATALKQRRFPREINQDIEWLLKQGRQLGVSAKLASKLNYLWHSCTGELSEQNDLFRLTYALETAKDMHWNYRLLSNSDWMTLKKQIEQHELRIVSLDVPTSWQALSDKDPSQTDPVTRAVITAINNMLIDLMAAMSHKDWLSRRQRQKQRIERAHTLGKYRGKQADQERHQKVLYYRKVKKLSIRETADATGYSPSQICRIQALYRDNQSV